MIAERAGMPKSFKRAVLFSVLLHAGLIVLIAASPAFNRPSRKGLVHYVNFIGGGGGGGTPGVPGGGPGGEAKVVAEAPPPPAPVKKETLRDLTVPQKAAPEPKSEMRHPVDKPKKTAEKKASITKAPPATAADPATEEAAAGQAGGTGAGYGLRFGTGSGTGGGGTGTGGGFGSGSGDPFGISGFPFSYYLQILSDRITANWFTSLVDTGVGGQYQTQVYFRIYKNGQISDLRVDVSSGVQAFDLSALRAIQSSAPFPPLPSEYDGQYLGITLIFEHVK